MSTTPAVSAAGPITVTFSFNEPFVERALEGLSHVELWRAPTSDNNPILWVAGQSCRRGQRFCKCSASRPTRAGELYSIAGRRSEISANIRPHLRWRVSCATSPETACRIGCHYRGES